jgi:NAD(P)-dependent dehydrogenase (short-subunit alcohol dehydrogenase family)
MSLPSTPSFRLDGQRALVTGASKGIGRAGAIAFAEAGAEVLLAARSLGEMEETVAALAAKGLKARAVALDVTDRAAVRRVVAENGPFDVLLNNAGTNIREAFLDLKDESLDALLDLNLRAMFTVAKAVAEGMVAAGKPGSIINLSSINGHVSGPNRTVYTATKHGVEGLTKAMAFELGPKGIRVNAVAPGYVETPLTRPLLDDPKFRERMTRAMPLGRIMVVEDIMGPLLFLASDASRMVSGHSLVIDGGYLTH